MRSAYDDIFVKHVICNIHLLRSYGLGFKQLSTDRHNERTGLPDGLRPIFLKHRGLQCWVDAMVEQWQSLINEETKVKYAQLHHHETQAAVS